MSENIKILKNAADIKPRDYVGYLWYSDSTKPEIIDEDNKFESEKLTQLPFVVEGMLFDEKDRISIRIMNIDGEYRISQMSIPEEITIQHFFAKKEFGEKRKIGVYQHYEDSSDQLNEENFSVSTPSWTAFVGFKN